MQQATQARLFTGISCFARECFGELTSVEFFHLFRGCVQELGHVQSDLLLQLLLHALSSCSLVGSGDQPMMIQHGPGLPQAPRAVVL
jgi:hypothetical protein